VEKRATDAGRLTGETWVNSGGGTANVLTFTYRSFAATEEMNKTALSNLFLINGLFRGEQRRDDFLSQACREHPGGIGVFRSADRAWSFAHGGAGVFFHLAIFQEDFAEFANAA
jgi:hypothetical protein